MLLGNTEPKVLWHPCYNTFVHNSATTLRTNSTQDLEFWDYPFHIRDSNTVQNNPFLHHQVLNMSPSGAL